MKKEGYSETTIERYVRLLKELAKQGDLRDAESIKVSYTTKIELHKVFTGSLFWNGHAASLLDMISHSEH